MQLPKTNNPYWTKDQDKASFANKFIGVGAPGSSTAIYAAGLPKEVVNCGKYVATDVVFVSVNGARKNRRLFDQAEVLLAIEAGAKIITDVPMDRYRGFNIGERELAEFLKADEYREIVGHWTPKP